jgi:hypothetical protein
VRCGNGATRRDGQTRLGGQRWRCDVANEAVFTIGLQRRRLRSAEPEDADFIFPWWADLQFLIVALRRLRRAAQLASQVPTAAAALSDALNAFDHALPRLAVMRNVGEHIDDYALDHPKRHQKGVDHRQLQVGTWDGTTYCWLGHELNTDAALTAAEKLYRAMKLAFRPAS